MQTEPTASTGTPTETVSAERVAAESGNVGAFLQVSRDRREGKAPASVERPKADGSTKPDGGDASAAGRTVAGRDGQPAKGPADKDREADERLTSRIRDAVDVSTADLRRQNQELNEQLQALRKGSSTEKPGADGGAGEKATERRALTSAEIKAYQAKPGAPKLDDKDGQGNFLYETQHDHAVALAEFIRETRESERTDTARKTHEGVERVKREAARVTTFAERVEAFKHANPDRLVDQDGRKTLPLSPEVGQLHGYAKLHEINSQRQAKGLAPLPATVDHAIAEELYDSELPMPCALYLSEHPEDLKALRACQSPAQLTRAFGALEERVRKATTTPASAKAEATPVKETAADLRRKAEDAVDRSVSSTRGLTHTLGRAGATEGDPEQTAVVKGDYGMFEEIQRAKRIEQLQGRAKR